MNPTDLQLPFPPANIEQWLQKVTDDLKGNKIPEDFILEKEGIRLDPFVMDDNPLLKHGPLDRLFDKGLLGMHLEVTGQTDGSKDIIPYLEKGANALHLHFHEEVDPDLMLKDIHLDYIFTLFEVTSKNQADRIRLYIEKKYEKSSPEAFIVLRGNIEFPNKTLYIDLKNTGGGIESMAIDFARAYHDILAKKPLRALIHYHAGKDLFWNIAGIRAIRIVWENLVSLAGFEGDIPAIVSCYPDQNYLSPDPNQTLIELSYMNLAGLLGNADINWTVLPTKPISDIYKSKAFLIQQIFKEEGRLHLVKDPVAGSYFIEQATRKIAEKIWAFILIKINSEKKFTIA